MYSIGLQVWIRNVAFRKYVTN